MILTIYKPDGTFERRPIGYTGGTCNQATAPYERRDIRGSTNKQLTSEACLPDNGVVAVEEHQTTKRG